MDKLFTLLTSQRQGILWLGQEPHVLLRLSGSCWTIQVFKARRRKRLAVNRLFRRSLTCESSHNVISTK